MFKSILVPATGNDSDNAVFMTAASVARLFGGHLHLLHVKADIGPMITAMAAESEGMWLADAISALERNVAGQEQRSSHLARDFCYSQGIAEASSPGRQGVSAEWTTRVGSAPDVVGSFGRCFDLIIAGREREDARPGIAVLEAALIHTGRPLLIVPEDAATVGTEVVAIAWKKYARSGTVGIRSLAVYREGPDIGRAHDVAPLAQSYDHQPAARIRRSQSGRDSARGSHRDTGGFARDGWVQPQPNP